jgi:hypothetical protein
MKLVEKLEGITTALAEECNEARSGLNNPIENLGLVIQACTDALLYGMAAISEGKEDRA